MALRESLETMVGHLRRVGSPALIERYVLLHGVPSEPDPQRKYPLGPMKECFRNAALLSLSYDLQYVEGFIEIAALPQFPIHHAWCLDREGRAVDNTLRLPGAVEYLGVPIPKGKLRDELFRTGTFGVFGMEMIKLRYFLEHAPELLDDHLRASLSNHR